MGRFADGPQRVPMMLPAAGRRLVTIMRGWSRSPMRRSIHSAGAEFTGEIRRESRNERPVGY
jgi:hypothetical protein